VATDLSEASDADELLICTAVHGGLLGQGLRSPLAHSLMRAAPPRLPPHTHTPSLPRSQDRGQTHFKLRVQAVTVDNLAPPPPASPRGIYVGDEPPPRAPRARPSQRRTRAPPSTRSPSRTAATRSWLRAWPRPTRRASRRRRTPTTSSRWRSIRETPPHPDYIARREFDEGVDRDVADGAIAGALPRGGPLPRLPHRAIHERAPTAGIKWPM
jgi:hypothetical protein